MIVPLNENIRIRGTSRCWQIEYLKQSGDETNWEPRKYFLTFRQALERAADDEIRTHPADTLADAIEAADAVATRYGRLLDCALEEIAKRDNPEIRLAS